jgi:RNA polymerase sigma-70 factor (ECF subfamily)
MSALDPIRSMPTADPPAPASVVSAEWLDALRPRLHRYCARMTGSVIDGEDVVQDVLMKVLAAAPGAELRNPEGWLFRVAHNAALDLLRQRARQATTPLDDAPELAMNLAAPEDQSHIAATSLRTFMRLPIAQRSSVILMDVLGYSLDEISTITETTIAAVKAALNRGRNRLREIAREPADAVVPSLAAAERARLAQYVERFNARDFERLRDMLADDVRLDLVGKKQLRGRELVGNYFSNYAKATDWHATIGMVEGQPALFVGDPKSVDAAPQYFILLDWAGDELKVIRDFRYARYVLDGAELAFD